MNTSIQSQPTTSAAASPPSLRTLAVQFGNVPLTRVALAFVDKRINLYLRFGNPARTIQLDRWRRSAVFLPASIFCRIRWESNDYGTTRWQLMVMQACTPLDAAQRSAFPAYNLAHASCCMPKVNGRRSPCCC